MWQFAMQHPYLFTFLIAWTLLLINDTICKLSKRKEAIKHEESEDRDEDI